MNDVSYAHKLNKYLADSIKAARKNARLSQEELAEKIGVHVNSLKRWESAERTPRPEHIEKISEALGINAEFFSKKE